MHTAGGKGRARSRLRLAEASAIPCLWAGVLLFTAVQAQPATASPSSAEAAGAVRVDFSPVAGPVGTVLQVQITAAGVADQSLVLAAVTWPQGCTYRTAQRIAAMGAIALRQGSATAQLTWPAELKHGQFGLCALAAADSSVVGTSNYAFTVSDGSVATATPVAATAAIEGPTSGLQPGATLTIDVENWGASDPITTARVMPNDEFPKVSTTVFNPLAARLVSQTGPGTFAVQVRPPLTLPTGSYYLLLLGSHDEELPTQPFSVGHETPSTAPAPLSNAAHSVMPSSNKTVALLVELAVAGLLVVAIGLLVAPGTRRLMRHRS